MDGVPSFAAGDFRDAHLSPRSSSSIVLMDAQTFSFIPSSLLYVRSLGRHYYEIEAFFIWLASLLAAVPFALN
jgi:hypothetical protein